MICLICHEEFEKPIALATHLRKMHMDKVTNVEDYTVKYLYNGVKPTCPICGEPASYERGKYRFFSHCKAHWMAGRIESIKGNGLKPEKYKQYCDKAEEFGFKILTPIEEFRKHKQMVKCQCLLCGDIFMRNNITIQTGDKTQTKGCSLCTLDQIGKLNSQKFKKSEEEYERTNAKILERQIEVLTPYKDYSCNKELIEMKCHKCNKTFRKRYDNLSFGGGCPGCDKMGTSKMEEELYDLVKDKYNVIKNYRLYKSDAPDRNGREFKEIDIYLPDFKFGIELHGLYWHSEAMKEKGSHLDKYNFCKARGVKVVQVFEDEWREHSDIILSMIDARCGKSINLPARKCELRKMELMEANKFLNENHISGETTQYLLGVALTYEGEIVSAITFRKPFTSKYPDAIEIARYAVKKGYQVSGGFARLLKYSRALFPKGQKVLTYSDLRFGDGDIYVNNGFEHIGSTELDYYYTDFFSRIHRFKLRAQDGKSERVIAEEAGVVRIYGTGSNIYLLGS